VAIESALVASARIREVGPCEPAAKADGSPVTEADRAAHEAIMRIVDDAFPTDEILGEEGSLRLGSGFTDRRWIVDPLDGTRDFVAQTGEYAVHVALTVGDEPVVAAVAQPVGDRLFYARRGGGAFVVEGDEHRRLRVATRSEFARLRVGITRFAIADNLRRFLEEQQLATRARQIGASIKKMAVAAGELDASVCLHGHESQWDTCAPGLIVREAGGVVSDADGSPLRYALRDNPRHLRGVIMASAACHSWLVAAASGYFE
jgi:3'(2'), 5'-bisphosphate nucleotidase